MRAIKLWATVLPAAALVSASCSLASVNKQNQSGKTGIDYLGLNLEGAELDSERMKQWGGSERWPSSAEIARFSAMHMNIIRLPLNWQRLQPKAGEDFDAGEMAHVRDVVEYANSKDVTVLLDLHGFGLAYGVPIKGGTKEARFLANFWARMATYFRGNGRVWFGLMNEPHLQSAKEWLPAVNLAVSAIRSSGSRNTILVSGTYWDKADTWVSTDNAQVIGGGVIDPINNYMFEVHWYPNAWEKVSASKMHASNPNQGSDELTAITQWSRQDKSKLFLGEVGVNTNPIDIKALDDLLTFVSKNGDVWSGLTYWSYPQNPNLPFTITSNKNTSPQLNVLLKHIDAR